MIILNKKYIKFKIILLVIIGLTVIHFYIRHDENRIQQKLKEEEKTEIKQQEYLKNQRNQKEPNHYLEKLKKEPTYFALVKDYGDYVNELYELEFEDTTPVLCFIDFINGEKKIFHKMYLDENISNNTNKKYGYGFGFYDFAFADSDEAHYYVKFYENKIEAVLYGTHYKTYRSYSIDKIMAEMSASREKIATQYVGRYEYEKIGIKKNNGYSSADIDNLRKTNEIFISFQGIGNMWMTYYDEKADKAKEVPFFIEGDNFDFFRIASDGMEFSHTQYYYFDKNYLIYYWDSSSRPGSMEYEDMEEREGEYRSIEYRIYYKKNVHQ